MGAKVVTVHGAPAVRLNVRVNGTLHRKCITDREVVPTYAEAEALAAAFNHLLTTGRFVWTEDGPVATAQKPEPGWLFPRYAAYWRDDHRTRLKATTRKFYDLAVRYLTPPLATVPIGSVTRPLCREVVKGLDTLKGLRAPVLARTTREGIYHTLQAILTAAVDDDLLPFNPATRLEKYLGADRRAFKKLIDPYTFAESERFLIRVLTLAPYYYPLCLLLLRTGVRIGEAIELRWAEDFSAHRPHQLQVQRNYSPPQAKEDQKAGLARALWGIGTPKGGRSRYVDLTPQVEATWAGLRAAQGALALKRGQPAPALVYTAPRGGRIIPQHLLQRILPRVCTLKRDDLPAPVRLVTLHTFRHTYVTQMLLKHGILALPYISQQVGHQDVATTKDTYAHWITDHQAQLNKRLDEPAPQVVEFPWGASDRAEEGER